MSEFAHEGKIDVAKLKHPQKRVSQIFDELFALEHIALYQKRKQAEAEARAAAEAAEAEKNNDSSYWERRQKNLEEFDESESEEKINAARLKYPQKRISQILDELFSQDQIALFWKRKREKAEAEVAELEKSIK